jgi:dTDP-4-amino-4,6-dideoxygalactose transaminase
VAATVSRETSPVPPLNLAANFAAVEQEVLAEMTAICRSGHYVLGPKVAAFEEALAAYCGTKHALGMSSGTDALLAALMALGVGAGDEVIVPTFTFFGTAGVVARLGARPVFCDIDPRTFNIDPAEIERRITARTKAIMPVHLYGELADMHAIETIAAKRGLPIVEDAAQAVGAREAEAGGRMAGAIGTCGGLSFYPTKNLGAIGDAGALTTNDMTFYETCRKMRVHGSGHTYYHDVVGGNFRIDALQAAILTIKLKQLENWTEARRARAARYRTLIEVAGLAPERVRPPAEPASRHVYHQFVVRAQQRDELAKHLTSRQIGCGVYYPLPLHLQKCFAALGGKPGDYPHSERAAAEVLALPMYPELTERQQEAVVGAMVEFYAA